MNTKTTAVPFYQTWEFRICVGILVLLFAAGAIAFYQYVRFMGLGNLRYYTVRLFYHHIELHEEKHGQFPTCQPMKTFQWLTMREAICEDSFDSHLDTHSKDRTYDNMLRFASGHHEARFAFRPGHSRGDFFVVLLIGYNKKEVEKIDQLVRQQQFDGETGLVEFVKKTDGFFYISHLGNDYHGPQPEVLVQFFKEFIEGYDTSIEHIWREREADRQSKPQ